MHPRHRLAGTPAALAVAVLAVAVLLSTGPAAHAVDAPPAQQQAADPALAALIDRFAAESREQDYYGRLQQGQIVDRIPAGTMAEARDAVARAGRVRAELAQLDQARLAEGDRVSAEILAWSLGHQMNAERQWWYEFPVTPYTTFDLNVAMQALAANPLRTDAERAAWLSLVDSIAARLDATVARIDAQAERGIRMPALTAGPAVEYFEALQPRYAALPADAERRAAALAADVRDRFVAAARATVSARLEPARAAVVARLRRAEAEGPQTVGLGQYPGGKEAYRDLARFHTSLDITPEDVMAYGEARVKRVNAEIEAIAADLGIAGGREGIRRVLREDARFLAKSPDDVARRYMQAMARIMPRVPEYFSRQPRAPHGVRRLDPAAEATMTFGYYQPPTRAEPRGDYVFNGSRLEERSLMFAAPIIYHELVPGHHFQVALQIENERIPPFRRASGIFGFNAYTEGWAEYAAELAGEMGLYDDPYDRLGRLMLDAFLSARLVVDPGMNLFGWSLEQARQYMRDNTFQSETEIRTETLRYSTAIPGQALGYKIGHRALDELRAAVRRHQGDAFDIRAFHDAVLDGGAMPMTVLQAQVARRFGLPADAAP